MNLTSLTLTQLLPKHRFARSVSIMAGGTALAQFAGILAAPVLTRIYAPDDFGILAAFVALLAIVSVFSTLRYDLAIPLPKSDQEAAPALGLCFIAVTIFSLLAAVVTYSSGEEVGGLIRLPQLSHYLWLLPIAIAFGGIYESLLYWAIRSHAFPLIARTKIYQVLTLLIVQLSTFPLGSLGLLLGLVAGQAMAAVCLALPLMRQRWLLFRQIRVADLFRTARRYRRFPLFSTWASGFSILSTHIPPLMLAALFSPAAAGLYAVSHRILAMPMGMVGQAVGDAFRAEAAEARREARLPSLVINIYEKLVQIAMPPALLLILAGPESFPSGWHLGCCCISWFRRFPCYSMCSRSSFKK